MKTVEWSDALSLGYEPMDVPHREFVELIGLAQQADDGALTLRWREVVDHAQQHFAQEDQWMRQSRFSTAENHLLQHRVVLNVMREGLALARDEQFEEVHEMANELANWFSKHTQSLDAALALHLRRELALPTGIDGKKPRRLSG